MAVSAQKEVLSEAYRNYLLSYVSIDRGALLRELNEAEILMSHADLADNEALNAAYDSARTVYETYKVTQHSWTTRSRPWRQPMIPHWHCWKEKKHCRHRLNWRSSC